MTRRLLFLFFLFLPMLSSQAQRKEIAQAKSFVKSRNNLPQAEEMIRNLLKDSINREKEKIWLMFFDAIKGQYEHGNEQLYRKQQYDTAQLFNTARKMFTVLEEFDSIATRPDKKGRINLKYRRKHSEFLNVYRPNIYNGGMFFVKKKDYAKAFDFFSTYIDCKDQPLFSNYNYGQNDHRLPRAAYMSVYCGFKLKDFNKTMKYSELAKTDTSRLNYLYQYFSEMYSQEKDTGNYLATISEGFARFPKSMFFFPRIFDYYFNKGDISHSLEICEKALAADSTNAVFLYAKSTVMFALGKYDECIKICDYLIEKNNTMADAYLTAGLAYYNQAVKLGQNTLLARKEQNRLKHLYKSALPYIQKYRELVPDGKNKWGLPLYTIYLNLNMGKEFDEIDKLLKEK